MIESGDETPGPIGPGSNYPQRYSAGTYRSDVSRMKADITMTTPIASIVLCGRLDAVSAVQLRHELAAAFAADQYRIVVDLSAVEFVDSAGLAALANGMRRARQNGGDLRIVYPESGSARRVFALTRFDQVFVAADSISEEQAW